MQKNSWLLAILVIFGAAVIGLGAFYFYQTDEESTSQLSIQKETTVEAIAATLSYQQGDIQVSIAGAEWEAVETDTVFHQGDSIKTGTDSKAIVEFENGDVVRLGYDTELFFTALNDELVTVSQISGASYNRVEKNLARVYQVKTDEATIWALGTVFDVIDTDEAIDVGVIESTVKVETDNEQKEVDEGESATINKDTEEVDVVDINKAKLTNDWYTWNKEEDSKKTDDLGVLEDYAGPSLSIDSPYDGLTITEDTLTVSGTVGDFASKITVNGEEVKNNAGQFSQEVTLSAGKNIITVTAADSEGFKTIKEVKITYKVSAVATPIVLEANTEDEGVHLAWNESTNAAFVYYKVVRSEDNSDLKYPDDGYISVKEKGQESFTDTTALAAKTYYYRVCEVMAGETVFCSNVAHMQGKKTEDTVPTTNTNTDTNTNTQPITDKGITLSATADKNGINFSWTVNDLSIEYGFKIVRGTAANPVYPGNDFKYITDNAARSYTWPITDGKTYHFRICQYNGTGECLLYSLDVEQQAYELEDSDVSLILSAKAESTGIGLWWTDVSSISGFKYYKVVRSETNADLRYPDDSYIAVQSGGEESYRDYSSVKGTSYYYRICAVGDSIVCSNVVQVTPTHTNAVPSAVTLSGTYSGGSVVLTWGQSNESDFKYYKVAWSQTNATPAYPTDGYIKAESTVHNGTFTDDGSKVGTREAEVELSDGIHYYSVCVVDSQNQVACSNTVTLVDGVVQ